MSEPDDHDDELTAGLARLGEARAAVEPLPGFTSRMLAGARRERVRRRRNRIAGVSLASAAAVAGGALWLTRAEPEPAASPIAGGHPTVVVGPQDSSAVASLLEITDVDLALQPEADWDHITDPIAAADLLLEDKP